MPMGLMNTPAIFIRMMNNLFKDMLDQEVVVFLDDMLIYSTTLEGHFKFLEKVFTCLQRYKFYCKLKKCSFLQWTTTFLGFDISPEGLQTSDAKIKNQLPYNRSVILRFCAIFPKNYKGIQ